VVENLSNVCKGYLALEKENQRLSAALTDVHRKRLLFACSKFLARKIALVVYCLVFDVTRGCSSSRCRQVLTNGPGG
jgi:hypothetical protein